MTDDEHPPTIDPLMAEALDWVLRLHDAPDDTRLRARLRDWLASDPRHDARFRAARRAWDLSAEVAPVHRHRWAAKPSERRQPRAARRGLVGPRRWVWWTGLAGIACAACVALFLLTDLRLLAEADLRTAAGEIRGLTLPDGSVVTLGGDSALAVRYSATQRHVVLLKGAAFFDVAHDSLRPFTVAADGATARDIGTRFAVDIGRAQLAVAVASGVVSVSVASGTAEELTAGQRITIDRDTGRARRGTEPIEAIGAWRSGRLVADNLKLREVVDQIGRSFGGFIWIRDADLAKRRVSGIYNLDDPRSALRAAVAPHAGEVWEVTPYLLIVSKRPAS